MNNKKIVIFPLIVFCLVLPFVVSADCLNNPLPPIECIAGQVITTATNVMSVIAGGFIIIMFCLAGFKYLTAQGNPQQVKEANQAVIWGLAGAGVIVLAWSIRLIVATQLGV